MRRFQMILLLLTCMLLGGCSQASQVENHAYVLVMGLDRMPDGQIQMTVQVPRISGGEKSSGSSSGKGSYTQFVITVADYEAALAKLNWASPRDLTLSQLKLIVFSREIAEDAACRQLIENIAQTERLYTATRVAVCEGKAKDFVKAIQPHIGTRISEDIEAMYGHYTSSGYVPSSSLAELFYQTESIYSDPMATYAILDKRSQNAPDEEKSLPAAALSEDIAAVSEDFESDIAARYLGAAVFSGGEMKGVFTGEQCIMANLIRNEVEAFQYECDGQTLDIVPARAVFVNVDPGGEQPRIKINAHLAIAAQERKPNEHLLHVNLERDLRNVLSSAQQMEAEPFGFAEKAATAFLTIDDWKEYNWKERFRSAVFEIELHFAHSDA